MIRAVAVGVVIGILLVLGAVYSYFATGRAPVATSAPNMPFERKMANMALHAYLEKLRHPSPQVPADEENLLEGAKGYKENCAVCRGVPGQSPTAIAAGMAPLAPHLLAGPG